MSKRKRSIKLFKKYREEYPDLTKHQVCGLVGGELGKSGSWVYKWVHKDELGKEIPDEANKKDIVNTSEYVKTDENFPKRLKKLRKDKELNQDEVSPVLNKTRGVISAMERGVRGITDEEAEAISKKLDVSKEFLLLGKKEIINKALPQEENPSKDVESEMGEDNSIDGWIEFWSNVNKAIQEAKEEGNDKFIRKEEAEYLRVILKVRLARMRKFEELLGSHFTIKEEKGKIKRLIRKLSPNK